MPSTSSFRVQMKALRSPKKRKRNRPKPLKDKCLENNKTWKLNTMSEEHIRSIIVINIVTGKCILILFTKSRSSTNNQPIFQTLPQCCSNTVFFQGRNSKSFNHPCKAKGCTASLAILITFHHPIQESRNKSLTLFLVIQRSILIIKWTRKGKA